LREVCNWQILKSEIKKRSNQKQEFKREKFDNFLKFKIIKIKYLKYFAA